MVREGFGRPEMDFQDIYRHVTNPESIYLLRNGEIKAMASYNTRLLWGINSLIVEGISMLPEVQGKEVFRLITEKAIKDEQAICLRTQNPRMYRALEKFCTRVYPRPRSIFGDLNQGIIDCADRFASRRFLKELSAYLNCKIDGNGVVRGYYGRLFYGEEPTYCRLSRFFKEDLKMDLSKGDAVLVIGIR